MSRLEEALKRAEQLSDTDTAPGADLGQRHSLSVVLDEYPAERRSSPEHRSQGQASQHRSVPPIVLEPEGLRVGRPWSEKLVSAQGAPAPLIEQYRQLAATVYEAQAEKGIKSLMVSSAIPREGKTLTATNLALTLSESYQQRVLLIDADLRAPSVHELVQVPLKPGLTDYLSTAAGNLAVTSVSPRLSVLAAGKPTANPIAGLVSRRMTELVAEANKRFEWVIIDTPPIGLLPDANLVARVADAVIFVISAGRSPYPLVQRAIAQIGQDRILGVILNRAEASAVPSSSHYRRYAVT
jgi:capsular exopolysaccharide synthesis family protein